jgi:hypothetical protein
MTTFIFYSSKFFLYGTFHNKFNSDTKDEVDRKAGEENKYLGELRTL